MTLLYALAFVALGLVLAVVLAFTFAPFVLARIDEGAEIFMQKKLQDAREEAFTNGYNAGWKCARELPAGDVDIADLAEFENKST